MNINLVIELKSKEMHVIPILIISNRLKGQRIRMRNVAVLVLISPVDVYS